MVFVSIQSFISMNSNLLSDRVKHRSLLTTTGDRYYAVLLIIIITTAHCSIILLLSFAVNNLIFSGAPQLQGKSI